MSLLITQGFGQQSSSIVTRDVTLTIVDNANDTGATATVSGTGGASYEISVQAVNGALGSAAWTQEATGTGDGTASLPVASGYYWAQIECATNGVEFVAPLVYFKATSGTDSVSWRCKVAAQALIQSLDLAGVSNTSVVILKQPWPRNFGSISGQLSLPGVLIADWGAEQMNFAAGTNARDDVGYPILVSIAAADNQDLSTNLATYNEWRQQIARAFRNQALVGVPEIYTCHVEPLRIAPPNAFLDGYYLSPLLLRFISREVRGLAS